MGKNKLAKFADMEDYPHVFQYPFSVLKEKGFALKGRWKEDFFRNNNPIVLELGCGKGEYTVGMAKLFPDKNFIGVDIKGARMWTGAKQAVEEQLSNVAFLRTHIELINEFFSAGEVSEIWVTFPDPQMNKTNKRMTSTRFMQLYRSILTDDGMIHLKTDSNFMFSYTCLMAEINQLPKLLLTDDLYHDRRFENDKILNIQTYYEQQWLSRGLNIKYIRFECPDGVQWQEPDVEIEKDSYRSFGRNNAQSIQTKKTSK
ncbi:MAG: tRNA (guanosine(46)-N7)-methyltransferase TrmB [Dysgonamonadaceae bacterium]